MGVAPFVFDVELPEGKLSSYDVHIVRRLSSMAGQYLDDEAYARMLEDDDRVLYEVFQMQRPEVPGELLTGISVLHPGKVGSEYFMTKGHFHAAMDAAEVYYCLQGQGMIVMETAEGKTAVEEMRPGRVLYVLPRWAHRSVNTGREEDLVTFFVCPANAGHDYGTIEQSGFRKIVIERNGEPAVVDNPRWGQGRL